MGLWLRLGVVDGLDEGHCEAPHRGQRGHGLELGTNSFRMRRGGRGLGGMVEGAGKWLGWPASDRKSSL